MAFGQLSGSQPLFTGVCFVWSARRSRIQVPRSQPFPQLPWTAVMIGICIALPCAEESACNALGTSHHRTFALAMVSLLESAFGFNLAVLPQDVPTASGGQGQAQSAGNNS